jgi:hypothetical protein
MIIPLEREKIAMSIKSKSFFSNGDCVLLHFWQGKINLLNFPICLSTFLYLSIKKVIGTLGKNNLKAIYTFIIFWDYLKVFANFWLQHKDKVTRSFAQWHSLGLKWQCPCWSDNRWGPEQANFKQKRMKRKFCE